MAEVFALVAKGQYMLFRDTRISFDRDFFSYKKVQNFTGWLIRGRRSFVRRRPVDYLNIGCGPNISDQFINLDWTWRPGIDICWDLVDGIPLESNSLSGCFTEHCLEHLEFKIALQTLREIHRVLKQGATVRIVVPDPVIYIDEFVKHRNGEVTSIPLATPDAEPTPMMSINRVFRNFGHRYAWDYETLSLFLARTGFERITRQTFGRGAVKSLLVDTPERRIESLYVEAVKP